MRKIFFANAGALINDLSEYVIGIYTCNDSNFRIFRHRVNRIADYVEKSLLKLFCIPIDKGFSDPGFHSNVNVLAFTSRSFNRTVSSITSRSLIFLKSGVVGLIAFKKCEIIPSNLSTSFRHVDKDFFDLSVISEQSFKLRCNT